MAVNATTNQVIYTIEVTIDAAGNLVILCADIVEASFEWSVRNFARLENKIN